MDDNVRRDFKADSDILDRVIELLADARCTHQHALNLLDGAIRETLKLSPEAAAEIAEDVEDIRRLRRSWELTEGAAE